MPDFFVDHFVVSTTLQELISNLENLAEQGGGNIIGTKQFIRRGGNSVNTASALLELGINPHLIVKTDEYGAALLKSLVSPLLDLRHVHTNGELSSTVSFEVEHNNRKVNLMVSDSGSAADFAFTDLTEDEIQLIRNSPLIALLCLNHNPNAAQLAEDVFSLVRENSQGISFMDTGDPSNNPSIIEPIVKNVLSEGLVDIIGMNENEARWFAWIITGRDDHWRSVTSNPNDWLSAGKLVSQEMGVRVDLHTPIFSASINDDKHEILPVFKVETQVSCGAGDAWNAGNIYGTLLNLPSIDRLKLANAVAALYVSSSSAKHPTRKDVLAFLKQAPTFSNQAEKLLKRQR